VVNVGGAAATVERDNGSALLLDASIEQAKSQSSASGEHGQPPSNNSRAEVKADSGLEKLAEREGRLSRGLSFGSSQFVSRTIAKFRDTATARTRVVFWGKIGGRMLCCAGRAANGDNFSEEANEA